ncbi:hypothetical protein [Candidatus Amarolinea dominans]|uniref:hypothetical protein n=1 Tax=Candidatus Amarolinea dominans TaxID=3140696 RepID=UPI001E00E3F2|nr:hypothetical protein [Anaerolineae bacterium]
MLAHSQAALPGAIIRSIETAHVTSCYIIHTPPRHPDGIPPGHWDENQAPDGYQPRNPSLLERSRHWLRGPDDLAARNRQNVLIDGIGVGFAAGIGTFLSVFLVRLGASNFMVGLLTAMPALTGILLAFQVGASLAPAPGGALVFAPVCSSSLLC